MQNLINVDLINVHENKREKCHLKENNEFECNNDLHLTTRERERDETQRNVCINDSMSALMTRN